MFGAQNNPSSLFGQTPARTAGFTFGTPAAAAATTSGFTFGGATNQSTVGSAGTLFSSTALTNPTTSATSLGTTSFTGLTSTSNAAKTGFTPFGQTASTTTASATGLFGGSFTTVATGTGGAGPTSGFTFNNPLQSGTSLPTQSAGFGLAAGSTQPSLNLGSFGTTTAPGLGTSSFSLSGGGAVNPSLSLGQFGTTASVAPSTSAPSLGFGTLGGAAATVPSLGLGLSGSGVPISTIPPILGLGSATQQAYPATTGVTGLGGVSVTQATPGDAKNDSKTLKEYPVPNEITQLTEEFQKHMKAQKMTREEIAKISSKSFTKVQEETASMKQILTVISNGIQRNIMNIIRLKQETTTELRNAETMHRTKDIPLGLQYENTAPTEYFQNLITMFEAKMQTYRQQIEVMEKHLQFLTHVSAFTPQDLLLTMRKIHDAFVSLAAELQTLHEIVEIQKDRYQTYRRLVHNDNAKVFGAFEKSRPSMNSKPCRVSLPVGPSPFGHVHNATVSAFTSALEKAQQQSGVPPTVGLSSGALGSTIGTSGYHPLSGVLGTTATGFGANPSTSVAVSSYSSPSTPLFGSANQTFQLQKPPIGNKRGKR